MILLKEVQRKIEICLIMIIVFAVSLFVVNKYLYKNKSLISYDIDGDIKYNVVTKNKIASDTQNQSVFISNNTDLINANFKYHYKINENVDYKYKYRIEASVISELDDGSFDKKEVYRKNKVLKETDYLSFNINGFIVDENINLNFDEYNKIAIDFYETSDVDVISKLVVTLYIDVNYNNDKTDEFKYYLMLPLDRPSFSIKKSSAGNKGVIYTNKIETDELIIDLIIIGIIIILFGIIIHQINRFFRYRQIHYAEFKYRKIMNDYDGIVVPINKLPKTDNLVTVKVLYFKNILDIQREMHLPIFCYKNEDVIIYMIISDKMVYVYFLNGDKEKI